MLFKESYRVSLFFTPDLYFSERKSPLDAFQATQMLLRLYDV